MSVRHAELWVSTHFSFLRGASSPDELFARAAELGIEALGVVDRGTLAGIVRARIAAKESGVRLVVGSRLDLVDGTGLLVYPTDRVAYGRLCRLLSLGKARAGKGGCRLDWDDVADWNAGMIGILAPGRGGDDLIPPRLSRLRGLFGDRAYVALALRRDANDRERLWTTAEAARAARVPTVATGNILYHDPDRRTLADVLTCIRLNTTIDAPGGRERHVDRHLKPPEETTRLFVDHPGAVERSIEIMDRCRFDLSELAHQYPEERVDPNVSPQQTLEALTWEGAKTRWPDGPPDSARELLKHELRLIEKLDYAPYFLTVNNIVRFARSRGILCQGRGSAANSAVCYVLGVTSVDPDRGKLLFERFVSEERHEPPDIDVDFEHERRETVIQWVFDHYGRDHAALCATVIRYRPRGALRDVGKAMGLPEDVIKALSSSLRGGYWYKEIEREIELREEEVRGLNLSDRRIDLTLRLASQLVGAPRHLSQHPGGFVLTHDRLDELVPIEPAAMVDRQVIEWDKDDIDELRFMKVDVLALGMLSCLKRGFDLLADHKGPRLDLAAVPAEDPGTYEMIGRADTIGVFQIESRAQMSMLPRLRPEKFYDLVIEVAIVRPGPIQGDMVHPYLRRREGVEPVTYPSDALREVLGKTLGVPLFQEQAMRVAIVGAGFTPGEADLLRKSMATFKHSGGVSRFRDKLVNGMIERGYSQDFAERTFHQLEGFGAYGFPESHAASFALLAYASAWMKHRHPDVFCCALLNAQPMGFYAPAQIVRDARKHGVEVRPVDLNASRWDCALEPTGEADRLAVRLGFRLVSGFGEGDAAKLVVARDRPYASLEDVRDRAGLPVSVLTRLAEADVSAPALGLSRRDALWTVKGLRDEPLPLFAAVAEREGAPTPEIRETSPDLIPMGEGEEVMEDYARLGLSLRAHPAAFLRERLRAWGMRTCAEVNEIRDGRAAAVAGLVLVRQRPATATGVTFITLEDETGIVNLVVWRDVYERYRRVVAGATLMAAEGIVQREGAVVHLVVRRPMDLSADLEAIARTDTPVETRSRDFH